MVFPFRALVAVGLIGRKFQTHQRTTPTGFVGGAFHIDGAVVFLNDAVHQCQAQASALAGALGGVEGLEYVIELFRGYAFALFGNPEEGEEFCSLIPIGPCHEMRGVEFGGSR